MSNVELNAKIPNQPDNSTSTAVSPADCASLTVLRAS